MTQFDAPSGMTTTMFGLRGNQIFAVLVAVLLGACSSSGKTSESATKTSVPSLARPASGTGAPAGLEPSATDRDLKKLLVPITDVPSGFTVRPPNQEDENETRVCDEDAFPRANRATRANVSFTNGQAGVLSEDLTSYASATEAESKMQSARAAHERCKAFDGTDAAGRVTHYVVEATSFERLADDQVAFRVKFDTGALSGTADFVAARVGELILVTAGLSVSSTPGSQKLEPGTFASFTKTAYNRIT